MTIETRFRPSLRRGTLVVFSLAVTAFLPSLALAQDWVSFVEESATRIASDPEVGIADPFEKDLGVGDLDRDGDTDLVVVRKVRFMVPGGKRNVLFMNENGTMVDRTATLAPAFLDETDDRDVVIVDVNDDGWLDVAIAGTFGEQPRVLMNRGLTNGGTDVDGIWLGLEYLPVRMPLLAPGPNLCSIAAGDVTGDGAPDLFFTDYENTLEDRLLVNDGDGYFTDQTLARMQPAMIDSQFGTDSLIVDVNGDGFLDIVKDNASGSAPPPGFDARVTVLYNNGDGTFGLVHDIFNVNPYMIAAADFTQDGRIDFFIVDDAQDKYLVNTGNDGLGRAQFTVGTVATSPATTFFGGNTKFTDLDQDGILDVFVADVDTDTTSCSRRLAILRGQGPAPNVSYSDPLIGENRPWLLNGTMDIEAFHIDHDGNLDLWISTCFASRVFMGVGSGVFFDGFESGDLSWWTSSSP